MSNQDLNPFLTKAIPTAEHVIVITDEALTDWANQIMMPYPLLGMKGEVVEIRQDEAFYIKQIVRKLLRDNMDEVDAFLEKQLGD